jgi:lysophospholipase L1-like esterase
MIGYLPAGILAALLVAAPLLNGAADEPPAVAGAPSCTVATALSAIDVPLKRSALRLEQALPMKIVAMGSSSTQGVGATAPSMSYPSRLEQELRDRFPDAEIKVLNRGVGGQDVREELGRFRADVLAEQPDLVIWQVGTNAVLRRDDLADDEGMIRRGVDTIRKAGMDLVLMDLQYAPRVLARPAWSDMERTIAEIARRASVGLFRRFEIMQAWDNTHQLAPAAMIGSDGLHMTDASYGCLANQLAEALAWNWWLRGKLAASSHRTPGAVAGLSVPAPLPFGDMPKY